MAVRIRMLHCAGGKTILWSGTRQGERSLSIDDNDGDGNAVRNAETLRGFHDG